MATPPITTGSQAWNEYHAELNQINADYHTKVKAEAEAWKAAMEAHQQVLTNAINTMRDAQQAAYDKYRAAVTV